MIVAITQRYKQLKDDQEIYLVDKEYIDIFNELGVTLLPVSSTNNIEEILRLADGLVITGSSIDINPSTYGEKSKFEVHPMAKEEDKLDFELITKFNKRNKVILGICRGIQSINVCFGGTLYQDISGHKLNKEERHEIKINKNSFIYNVYNKDKLSVNSLHHQAIKDLAVNFKIAAIDNDGIIEAIESDNIIAVQWHPEYLKDMKFFKYFEEKIIQSTTVNKKQLL